MTQDNGIEQAPIGVFDSGFGGLTILRDIRRVLPQYDYLFVGDNARAPYGTRSRELVYEFTLQAVKHLFGQGCHLVILVLMAALLLVCLKEVPMEHLAETPQICNPIRIV